MTWLIDTFVRKIFIFDGEDARIEIYCNASDIRINCAINEPLNSSSMAQLARLMRTNRHFQSNLRSIFSKTALNLVMLASA